MNKRTINILLALRIVLGLLFLYAGITKLLTNFTAAEYLQFATSGPFKEFFASMAGNSVIDFLVVFGEIGIGLALALGIFVRFASMCGILMMALFYFSIFPSEQGPITQHIIYILVFALLASTGAGRVFGLDKELEKKDLVKRNYNKLRYFLG